MKEWVVVACRAEAKFFERQNHTEDLRWLKTLTNKKGRRKEREFETDEPGTSYAKFGSACHPHKLEGKHQHAEIIAEHFSQQIIKFLEKSFSEKRFDQLTIIAGAHFLGQIRAESHHLEKQLEIHFIPKNIEKAKIEQIVNYLG